MRTFERRNLDASIAPLTVALVVTAGSQRGCGPAVRAVPGRHPRGAARPLGQTAAGAAGRARYRRRHARARLRCGARAREPVEHRVPARRHDARHRAHGPAARRSATACWIRSPWPARPRAIGAGVSGLPGAVHGYMDVVLHPRFAENRLVYLSYTKPIDEKRRTAAIARGRWDGKGIADMKDIFVLDEGTGAAVRLAFGRDASLYLTTTGAHAAGSEHAGGQGAAHQGRRLRSRWTTRLPASRITGPRCSRSGTAARWGWR